MDILRNIFLLNKMVKKIEPNVNAISNNNNKSL